MGIMGVISDAVLEGGGKVTGIVPYAIFASGGEKEKAGASTSGGVNSMEREKVRRSRSTRHEVPFVPFTDDALGHSNRLTL